MMRVVGGEQPWRGRAGLASFDAAESPKLYSVLAFQSASCGPPRLAPPQTSLSSAAVNSDSTHLFTATAQR